jgi:hypothetical protein
MQSIPYLSFRALSCGGLSFRTQRGACAWLLLITGAPESRSLAFGSG